MPPLGTAASRSGADEYLEAAFARAAERAARGAGVVFVLAGAPGSGKSYALATLRTLARERDIDAYDVERDPIIALDAGRLGAYFVDDLERRDAAYRRAVESIVRQLPAHAALLVVAVAPHDPFYAAAPPCERVVHSLQPWSDARIAALLRERGPARGRDDGQLAAIAARAGGNPRHACELLELGAPRTLLAAVGALHDAAPRLLTAAVACAASALADLRVDHEVLALAPFRDARAALPLLRDAGLVVDDAFYDEPTRAAVAALRGTTVVHRQHVRMARALLDDNRGDDVARRFHRVARHLERAGQAGAAAEYEIAVGNDRLVNGAFEAAAAAYERALALGIGDGAMEAKAWRDLAMARFALGAVEAARDAIARAVERYRAANLAGEATGAELLAARLTAIETPAALPRERVDRIRAQARDEPARAHRGYALWLLAGDALKGGRVDEALGMLEQIAPIAAELPLYAQTAVLSLRAIATLLTGTTREALSRAIGMMGESLQLSIENGMPRDACNASFNRAMLMLADGNVRAAKADLGAAFDFAMSAGHAIEILRTYPALAEVAILEGELVRARTLLARPEFADAPPFAQAWRAWPAARLRALTGDVTAYPTAEARRIHAIAKASGDPFLIANASGALALALDLEGAAGEAAAFAAESMFAMPQAAADYGIVADVAPLGDLRTLERGRALLAPLRATHHPDLVRGCTALLEARAAGTRDPRTAERRFEEARRALTAIGCAGLARSAPAAEDDGAPALADRALTPRERAVAMRAAEGVPNADIAGELGISRSTVEKHMSSVMHKLGLRSRFQLERALAGAGGAVFADGPTDP